MSSTTNHYHVLGLDAPSWMSKTNVSIAEIRRAYKHALLAAHPDKRSGAKVDEKEKQWRGEYTIDEIKRAYTILANEQTKAEYDNWLLLHPNNTHRLSSLHEQRPSADFILGLEVIDLSDFDVVECLDSTITTSSSAFSAPTSTSSEDESSAKMEWTRSCRCGADKGFRIREDELEDAERRGDKEVLVGCEGCSLWARVGFDIEEG